MRRGENERLSGWKESAHAIACFFSPDFRVDPFRFADRGNATMHRTSHRNTLDTRRLFAAADVLLRAIHSPTGFDTEMSVLADTRRFIGSLPLDMFTSNELIDAMAMLIRMGLVTDTVGPRAALTQ
jgi:hypothetical protein